MKAIIKNRRILLLIVFLFILLGAYNYYNLPKQESPSISAPVAFITTIYPGASQTDVDLLVTSKIEKELKSIEGYDYSVSFSNNSVSTIILQVNYGVNIDDTWDTLRVKMDEVQSELPDECYDITIDTNVSESAGIIIALSGDNYSYETLSEYGEDIIDRLSEVEGVTRFEMSGDISREVAISVDNDKLNQLDLSFAELSQFIQGQNLEIPSGLIETQESKISLNINGSFDSLEDIQNLIIGASQEDGSVLRLGDIAQVEMRESSSGLRYKNDGKNAVLLTGYFNQGENVLIIGDEVRSVIDELKQNLPDDLIFSEVIFQPEDVSTSINEFMINLLQGVLLVIFVVFVGMGMRNAIIVSTAIPLSIVMTFVVMPLVDMPIHQVSIIALIVALGMLVDNAIVVSDAIQNKLDEGVPRMEACVDGAKEVLVPVFSSTLTTIATLSPLLFLNSIVGDYIIGLPVVVMIALLASFIIAVTVTPVFAYMFFKPNPKGLPHPTHRFGYKIIDLAIHHKFLSVMAVLIFMGIIGSTFLVTEVIFFPKADKDIIYIDIVADKIIDLETTQNVSDQVEDVIKSEPGILTYTTAIGGGVPKFFNAMGITSNLPQNAQIVMRVDLSQTDFEKNTSYAEYLQAKIDKILIGGKATVKELENAFPSEAPITIRFTGDDFATINNKVAEVEDILQGIPGSKNVRTDYSGKKLEYSIDLDKNELSYLGLLKYDVLNEISIALRGRSISTFRNNGNEYDIILEGNKKDLDGINNLMIKSSVTSNKYIVKDVGQVELMEQLPTIKKYNGDYTIVLYSDVYVGYQRGEILGTLLEAVDNLEMDGVDYVFDGEAELIQENFGSAGVSAIFAVFAIYMILLFQFKNMIQPFIVLFTVPLSSAGAIFGLFLMGQPISFTALIGIISLIGIVVNNAIVLIDYINMKRVEGKSIEDSAKEASSIRLRPIMLSTITTISGLLPLVLSNSELFKPMAVALMFGLIVSTILTLVFIPLMYTILIKEDEVVPLDN